MDVIVRVLDEVGNVVTNATGNVTVAIHDGDGTLAGTMEKSPVLGAARFADLSLDPPGTYELAATWGGFQATSDPIPVHAPSGAVPSQLTITSSAFPRWQAADPIWSTATAHQCF